MTRKQAIQLSLITISAGLLLASVAMLLSSWLCYVLGQLLLLCGVVLLWVGPNAVDHTLSLSGWARSQIGPAGQPGFSILLMDSGRNKIAVLKRLRLIYDIGLSRAWFLIEHTPSVVQTAVSREEAEWVAARLSECGARVEMARSSE